MSRPLDPALFVRPELRALGAYHLDLTPSRHKLDQNEVPWDLPRRFKEEMAARLLAADWARYPDFHADELRRDLGRLHGHPFEGVLVGNGSNELLSVALTALVAPGTEVLGAEPSFGLYRSFVLKAGGVPRFLPPRPDLKIPIDELEAEVERDPRRPLLLCTPNNPTGDALPVERVERLLERLEAPLLLDNAYGEFCQYDYRPLLARYPHLIVFRTFSKAWSLAGMRLGYLLADPRLVTELIKVKLPYNLGHPRGDRGPGGPGGRGGGAAPGAAARGPPAAMGGDAGGGGLRGLPLRGELPADPLLAAGAGARGAGDAGGAEHPGARRQRISGIGGVYAGVDRDRGVAAGDAGGVCEANPHPPAPSPVPSRPPSPGRGGERTDGDCRADHRRDPDPSQSPSRRRRAAHPGPQRLLRPHADGARDPRRASGSTSSAEGDTHVDLHHTVEDVGIALGEALAAALGDRRGIVRFAHAYAPLDEALARAVIDLSGRGTFHYAAPPEIAGGWVTADFPLTLVADFFQAFADRGRLTLHLDILAARNGHHAAEAAFKAAALALRQAVARRSGSTDVPSTKGTLSA